MTEHLAHEDALPAGLFTVYAEPPWLLHLSGELDLDTAPMLTEALDGPIRRGGAIGFDLADLTYMDSIGVRVIFDTVRQLGERGRVVLYGPTPIVRRLIEICGLVDLVEISDDPVSVASGD